MKIEVSHQDMYEKGYREGYGKAMYEVEQKGLLVEWIPCSERLPEEHHIYLTTIKKANGITLTSHSYFFTKEVGWSDACVIAWMPLPEPYKRGEAE